MSQGFEGIENNLVKNINGVYELMNFDRVILDFSITALKELKAGLVRSFDIDNPKLLASNTIQMLENIRTNDSLRPRYKIMFNQSIVLLVSLFASAIADLFREGVNQLAKNESSKEIRREEFKLTVEEIMEQGADLPNKIGYLIADKKDISFQDMKSIGRAFREYFSVSMEKNETVNNIILSQAARHVIVHDSGRITERFLNQVAGAKPRGLKPTMQSKGMVQFDTDEIHLVGKSMIEYFHELRVKVDDILKNQS